MSATTGVTTPSFERRLSEARAREGRGLSGRERLGRGVMMTGFLAASAAVAAFAPTHRHPAWWVLAAAVVSYAVASRVEFDVGTGSALPTVVVLVPMLFVLPARDVPLAVAAGLVLAALAETRLRGTPIVRSVVTALASSWFALGPALVFVVAHEPRPGVGAVWVTLAALAAQLLLDAASATIGDVLALALHPRELVRPLVEAFTIDVLLAPVGFLAAMAAREEGWAVFLPAPLLLLLSLFARERRQRLDHVLELSSAYRGTAFLLGDVVEADDAYTGEHSRQVVSLVLAVSERLGLREHDQRTAEFTALLHDVGKIRIPASIIEKPGALTAEERAIIETHTIEGERLLNRVGGLLGHVGSLVRSCHERWDGGGYPDGLAGEEIPLIARIVCCCDAYNAMVTDRPYRKGRSVGEAADELRACRGTQFDPRVVDALLDVLGAAETGAGLRRSATALDECPECGRATLLAEPDGFGHQLCLRCGPVSPAAGTASFLSRR